MYKTVLFFYCCCFAFTSTAQNLLLNGDFEEYWECPDQGNQLNFCKYASNPYLNTSPDYFNLCWEYYSLNASYYPYSGNGMIGLTLGALSFGTPNTFREFVQLKLTRKLNSQELISLRFYVNTNLPTNKINHWKSVSFNELGIKFLDDSITFEQEPWNIIQPDWENTTIQLSEVNNWTPISFQYTARGGEEWILIGNFYPNNIFPFLIKDSSIINISSVYFYICIDQFLITSYPFPNIFTPNQDGKNDIWKSIVDFDIDFQITSVIIYNRWGRIAFEAGNEFSGWDGNCAGIPCSEGTYFAVVLIQNTQNNSIKKYTGNITLLR